MTSTRSKLENRVARAAEAALEARKFVTPIDVLVGIGWLSPTSVEMWRQGRLAFLEGEVVVGIEKIIESMALFRHWVEEKGLTPSEVEYIARTRDRRQLHFTASGQADFERIYRTHWISPALPEKKREKLVEKQSKAPELVVIWATKEFTCTECGGGGQLLLMEDAGPLCLTCADLDHLVYLPAGDATLTRRAKKASALSAVVVRWSRSRKRYERQGVLVDEDALAQAEQECLADEVVRSRRRERDAERRVGEDQEFTAAFSQEIMRLFPGCPHGRAEAIAARATIRGSGRVGRAAAGRALDPDAVSLAVVAAVRHEETVYDELLMRGMPRAEARDSVRNEVQRVLDAWKKEL